LAWVAISGDRTNPQGKVHDYFSRLSGLGIIIHGVVRDVVASPLGVLNPIADDPANCSTNTAPDSIQAFEPPLVFEGIVYVNGSELSFHPNRLDSLRVSPLRFLRP
jgi:hypothetical protein